MSERITRKDAEQALRVYCTRAGLPYGHYIQHAPKDRGDHYEPTPTFDVVQSGRTFTAHFLHGTTYVLTGGLALSCAYGGYQVQQIIGLDGTDPNRDGKVCTGVRTPFGGGYHTAREIVTMLRGAVTALELAEQTGK